MFDRLIESESAGADVKNRRGYFMISTVVVGILFLTAVVFSLYAQDLDLGVNEFELAQLLPPNIPAESPEPEPEQPAPTQPQTAAPTTELPSRQSNTQSITEQPVNAPSEVSTVRSSLLSRPPGDFIISSGPETNGFGNRGASIGTGGGTPGSSSAGSPDPEPAARKDTDTPPPPPIKKVEKPRAPVSLGPVNGIAKHLPKPAYPAHALAVNAQGDVQVQVTIDETGNVISAKAISGHPMLRSAAEKAAWAAKFTPTTLSNVAIKVTGVIVYKFKRD